MAGDLIADYLGRLRAGLPQSRLAERVVQEVEDGLRSAADEHCRHGIGVADAARLAVSEFGDPEDLAAEFVPVLATAQAHRGGLALLLTGPAVGACWLAAALLTWPSAPLAVGAGMAAIATVLLLTVPRIAYVVAATGRLSDRITTTPPAAVRSVGGAARTAVALDATLILIALPALVLFGGSALGSRVAAAAAAASVGRTVLAAGLSRRLHDSGARLR